VLNSMKRGQWRVNKYIWLCLAFALFWLCARHETFAGRAQVTLGWVFGVALVNVGLRTFFAFRSAAGTTGQWGWLFSIVDMVLIGVAVRLTGGLHSDLWLLFFPLMVTETLSASPKEEFLLTGLTFAGFTAGVWPVEDWVTFSTRLFFLYVVSTIARRLYQNAEERSRQLALLRGQLSVAEEQSRVARELHDGLGREIVNVILGLEVAKRVGEKHPEQVPALLAENIALLRESMNQTRDLIFQTRPWMMSGEGEETLGERIERYARSFAERTGISVEADCDLGDVALPPETAFGILRIVQEALTNAGKHSQAKHVEVTLCCVGKTLTARVRDDGQGFLPSRLGANGIGLHSMRERATGLGGELCVQSAPDEGTEIVLTVPV